MMKYIGLPCLSLLLFLAGCGQGSTNPSSVSRSVGEPSSSQTAGGVSSESSDRYEQAKHHLEQGRYESVIQETSEGISSVEKTDAALAEKLLLEQILATIRAGDPQRALLLLNSNALSALPGEMGTRKQIIFAEALCKLGKNRQGQAVLSKTTALLPSPSADPVLNAEWAFHRGRCEPFTSESAKNFYEQARKLAHGKDKFLEASAEGNLGYRLLTLEHFDEAIDHFKVALDLSKDIGSSFVEERILGNLGFAYYEVGDFQKAEYYSTRAERLASELGRIEDQAYWLIDVGRVEQLHGHYPQAEEYYNRALAIARKDYQKKDGNDKADSKSVIAKCLHNLALLELRKKDPKGAEEHNQQALALGLKGNDLLDWKLNQADIAFERKGFSEAEKLLKDLLPQTRASYRIRWKTQADLARVYESMGRVIEADKWYRAAIDTGVKAAAYLNREEYKTALLGDSSFYDDYVNFLVSTGQPVRALQVAELGRARALAKEFAANAPTEDTREWIARIQRGLRSNGKIVFACWEGETNLYTWLVTGSQVKLIQQPHPADEIRRLVAGYQREIDLHSKLEESPSARTLYDIMVKPVEALVPHGADVAIVADADLYDVNFESLIVAGGGLRHYWIEDVKVENAISVQTVAGKHPPQPHYPKDLLAMGAAVPVNKDFPPLAHAEEEIDMVKTTFAAALEQVFTQKKATPQTFFRSNPSGFRYIHFVAHGTRVPLEPLDSAIILSPDQDNSYKLYARDIAKLKLGTTPELVTISSCNSAGSMNHEAGGLMGLNWAFMHAGARQVVAALWKVDDAATPQLMNDLYNELARGKSPREALRDAKLAMLHAKGPHKKPYYWATLQLYTGS